MSTYEDRIVSLERKVAALELRRLYDEGLARENTPAEQGHNLREINKNMTILLDVIGKQGQEMKARFASLETKSDEHNSRLSRVETTLSEHTTVLNEHTIRFDRLETILAQVLARLPEKP